MTPHDDADLVERLRAREKSAQRDLYARCTKGLKPYFVSRLRDAGEADDYMHDVYVLAMEGLLKGNGPTTTLDGWLLGIAKNLLKKHYEHVNRRTGAELSPDLVTPHVDIVLELDQAGDLPALPTDLEFLLGKRELWTTMRAAVNSIGAGLRRVINAHIELSLREQRKISSAELAAELDMSPEQVDRQLHRARKATSEAVGALVLARVGGRACADLANVLDGVLSDEQRAAGHGLTLDQKQVGSIQGHVGGCVVCGPRAHDAQKYARWALGPGLVGVADDDERRRAVIALFNQERAGRTLQQSGTSATSTSATSALAAEPMAMLVQEHAGAATRQPGRLTTIAASWTNRHPVLNNVVTFATENPVAVRVVAGAAAVVLAIGGLVTASAPPPPPADAAERPIAQAQPTTSPTGTTTPGTPTLGTPTPGTPSPPLLTPTPTRHAQPVSRHNDPAPPPPIAQSTAPSTTTEPKRPPAVDRRMDIAAAWHRQAVMLHPAHLDAQREAARQAWEIYKALADEALATTGTAADAQLADIAYRLNTGGNLIGLLVVDLAVEAATKARQIYARLTANNPAVDHRMDIAGAWHRQAVMLHPTHLDAQREAARQAWEIYKTLADEALATTGTAADAQLADIAYHLNTGSNLIGHLVVDLAVEAATKARQIYARLTANNPAVDHRMDIAGAWHRQAVMLHPTHLDAQREAARQAWEIYKTLANEALATTGNAISRAQLARLAEQLNHLKGYLAADLAIEAAEMSRRIQSFLTP